MRHTNIKIVFAALAAALLIQATVPLRLQTEMDKLNADDALKHGAWGFCVMTADSGTIIASNNPDLSVIPASTMKILTTGAALGLLGPDFQYETTLEYDGTFDSIHHVLHGNLYIRGSGDPSFCSDYFLSKTDTVNASLKQFSKALSQMGIRSIDGDVIGDASCFSENPVPDGWQWGDLGQYYGAGTSGLCYKNNRVTLYFNSTKGDSCTLERIDPQPQNVVYRSYVKADGKKDEAYVYGAPFGNLCYIYGSIPAQKKAYEVDASNPDPALQCATDFLVEMQRAGFTISGKASTVRLMQLEGKQPSVQRTAISKISSPALSEIVKQTNIHSDNTFAEQLCRTLGLLKGEGGTTEAGTDVIKNYWSSLGVNLDGLNMTDGSGLSRSNLVTTFIEASVLQKISTMQWFPYFDQSLPVAGKSGSMTSLCKGTAAENNMHAKTGYINRARGYAGYVKTKSGRLLCFSLLANNYTCTAIEMKKKLEKILVAMAELP